MNDQRSLEDQLKSLARLAIDAKLYDADDFLIGIRRELAALRAQLEAAEERARKAEEENKRIREDCAEFRIQAGEAKLREMSSPCLACKQLAAARADAVREFAEQLDRWGHCRELSPMSMKHIKPTDDVARYLSSRGVPSAQPDDGRVERVARKIIELELGHDGAEFSAATMENAPELARRLLAAADGDKGGA